MSGAEAKIRACAKRYKPRGWKVIERSKSTIDGMAREAPSRVIYCLPLKDPYALYVYLHEVAHVLHKHCKPGRRVEMFRCGDHTCSWLEEFEAEQFAIRHTRKCGYRVSRDTMAEARSYVGSQFLEKHADGDENDPHFELALRFAFPKAWRQHLR